MEQLTSPVRWTQTVLNMNNDGMEEFEECGPGSVLTGLISKILQIIWVWVTMIKDGIV